MEPVSGGQLVAEALVNKGVEVIFTLSGGHITPIYQHLENSSIRLFDTRHEQAAVFMAEAYGRMKRKPGVAMVTAGPGFTNALTAIANARQANSPLVLISGCVGVNCSEKLDLQDMDQAPVIAPMVKKALVCHTPSRIPEFIDQAFRTAGSGRPGPVYLELPVDMLNAQCSINTTVTDAKSANTILTSKPVDLAGAEQIVKMIQEAKKPAIFAGSGAWYSNAEQELVAFAEKTGIPVFTSSMGRGTIPDSHPLCFESAVGVRPGATLFAQAEADLIILLGVRLSLFFLFGDLMDKKAKIIQADIEPEEIGRNQTIDLGIVSDLKPLLAQCNLLIDQGGVTEKLSGQFDEWVEGLRGSDQVSKNTMQPSWDSEETPIHPLRLAKEINEFMNQKGDIVVADGGDTQVWMNMTRMVTEPGKYFDSGLFGCLGVGIPFANAARFLNPDSRVCLIIGDGSVGFNFMEFETALRKKLPVVVVISNDLGWGMIRHSQELKIGHAIEDGTFIGEVQYHKMVEALGGFGKKVTDPNQIRPALEEAFASGKPACINVMTDPTTISPGSFALANVGAYK